MSTLISHTTRFEKKIVTFKWDIVNWNDLLMLKKGFRSKTFLLKEISLPCYVVFHFDVEKKFSRKLKMEDEIYVIQLCTDTYKSPLHPVNVFECSIKTNSSPEVSFNKVSDTNNYVYDKCTISLMYTRSCKLHYEGDYGLTILLKIAYGNLNHTSSSSTVDGSIEMIKQNSSVLTDYHTLYEKQELCDVTFIINESKIKAHKFVLALTSSYFHSMFTQDTKESREHTVNFSDDPDINFEILQGFLEFIYNIKTISELKKINLELLVLADKFDVKELKSHCEQFLAGEIDENNAAKFLIVSEKHNSDFLKNKVIAYAKCDMSVLTKSPEFTELCKNENLMSELLLLS